MESSTSSKGHIFKVLCNGMQIMKGVKRLMEEAVTAEICNFLLFYNLLSKHTQVPVWGLNHLSVRPCYTEVPEQYVIVLACMDGYMEKTMRQWHLKKVRLCGKKWKNRHLEMRLVSSTYTQPVWLKVDGTYDTAMSCICSMSHCCSGDMLLFGSCTNALWIVSTYLI